MGVIYKLKPEIINFILAKKRKEPALSCRVLSEIASKEYKVKVSKSSINTLFKTSGLSMPVGRRKKIRKHLTPEFEGAGAIFLKAADYILGGTNLISQVIEKRLKTASPNILSKTEYLLYHCLFEVSSSIKLNPHSGLWFLINQRFINEDISAYLVDLKRDKELSAEIFRLMKVLFHEVYMVKIELSDGNILFLDGQMHTIWSSPRLPGHFSTTLQNIKNYATRYFLGNEPFSLFMTPGYDKPTDELFDFLEGFQAQEKQIKKITFCGNKLEELGKVTPEKDKKYYFLLGLWPWQFKEYLKAKKTTEFDSFYSKDLKESFSIADTELELSKPTGNKTVILRGCILKRAQNNKTCLTVLSNLPADKVSKEELADIYLKRWPNLEEGFRDHSHKVELFAYTGQFGHFLSPDELGLSSEYASDVGALFDFYLKGLNSYVKYHFLPLGYEKLEFSQIKERFYDLKAAINDQKDRILVIFRTPPDYKFLKDLEYACHRVNEREILIGKKRLWLLI